MKEGKAAGPLGIRKQSWKIRDGWLQFHGDPTCVGTIPAQYTLLIDPFNQL
jgi:hypothetical protein